MSTRDAGANTADAYDFLVVGAGSAGAVVAARLSEDPSCRVALIEAGGPPPAAELMPLAAPALQLDPETDWCYTADAGHAGLGLTEGRMAVPRGKMLGGSSAINYMGYVRGHPGDFDTWEKNGATGWGYRDVLPYFKKSEGLTPSDDVVIDAEAHSTSGPLGVSVRSPVLQGSREFVDAAVASGIPAGDYNARDRGGAAGVASLVQTTTRDGKRSSTYHAFLEPEVERRPNLTVITGAQVTRVLLQGKPGDVVARGVEYQTAGDQVVSVLATKEVVLSAGAVGSAQILLLSGVGPKAELEAIGVVCRVDLPEVGKHLKDHLVVPLAFEAPGVGVSLSELGISMGADALRQPGGPLPADPALDVNLPAELVALRDEADRRVAEWMTTGHGLASSSLFDAVAFFSTGLGDFDTHDAQIQFYPTGFSADLFRRNLRIDPDEFFADAGHHFAPETESITVLATPVKPHSEGEVVLTSSDPIAQPNIRMNYLADPHDMKVMIAVVRKSLDVIAHWPASHQIGPLLVPPALAAKHDHIKGEPPSDALIEDIARHYSHTVYHLASTCRIGSVVDPRLKVLGVDGLRVADASVMPDIVSGNTNAACIMIGEKAAKMIAVDQGMALGRSDAVVPPVPLRLSHALGPRVPAIRELTLGQALAEAAAEGPDRLALIEGIADASTRRSWTYRKFHSEAEQVAHALLVRFGPGDHIAVWAQNIPEWALLEFGCAMAGMVLVTVNPAYREAELAYVLSQSRAKGLFTVESYRNNAMLEVARTVQLRCPDLETILCFEKWDEFVASGIKHDSPLPTVTPGDVVMMQYTSGTTGFPKGAMLHHLGLVNNGRHFFDRMGMPPAGVYLTQMPLFHTAGSVMSMMGCIGLRCTQVLLEEFDSGLVLELCETYGVNATLGVPTMFVNILENPSFESTDLSAMTVVSAGGSSVAEHLLRSVEDRVGAICTIMYGQTECSPTAVMNHTDDSLADRARTIGTAMPCTEVKVVDALTGEVVPVGAVGELCTKGYHVMTGYYGMPAQTAEAIDTEGWLHTGDLAAMDDRGYCTIEGRLKDMIIRGGENIYPREIEDLLSAHRSVAEVAVVGLPDDRWGETVGAFIRPGADRCIDKQELILYLREHLAPSKTPKEWVEVQSFPMTGSGKIQKFVLRDQWLNGEFPRDAHVGQHAT